MGSGGVGGGGYIRVNYVINRRISHAIIEFRFGFIPFLPPTIAWIVFDIRLGAATAQCFSCLISPIYYSFSLSKTNFKQFPLCKQPELFIRMQKQGYLGNTGCQHVSKNNSLLVFSTSQLINNLLGGKCGVKSNAR